MSEEKAVQEKKETTVNHWYWPPRTTWIPWVLLALALVALIFALRGCGTTTPTPTAVVGESVPVSGRQDAADIKVNNKSVGTVFDNRVTATNGEILTGHLPPYADTDLQKIENTWLTFKVNPAPGRQISVFATAVRINGQIYNNGALLYLGDQTTTVDVLNGEVIVWKSLSAMHTDISARISSEIAHGNLSINRPLAFSWISQEFSGYVPRDLLDARKVQVVQIVK